jgi:hypothetical protein
MPKDLHDDRRHGEGRLHPCIAQIQRRRRIHRHLLPQTLRDRHIVAPVALIGGEGPICGPADDEGEQAGGGG